MTGRRFRYAALVLAVAAFCLCGCSKYRQIRPVSAHVESIMPSGLRSVAVTIAVEVDNPSSQVKLFDIEGTVFHSGKVFGRVTVDPFVLEARSLETYHLDAVLTLDGDVSLRDLMSLLKGNVIEECTIDFYAKASLKGGVSKKLEFKQLPLKELYELVKK